MRATQQQIENGLDYLVMLSETELGDEDRVRELYINCRALQHKGYNVKKYLTICQEIMETRRRPQ